MSSRLNQERESELQPKRMESCQKKLEELGYVVNKADHTQLTFLNEGSLVRFWPYSGWHTGKSIQDGRGFNHLLKQLKQVKA